MSGGPEDIVTQFLKNYERRVSNVTLKRQAHSPMWTVETVEWHSTHGKAQTLYRGAGATISEAVADLELRMLADEATA